MTLHVYEERVARAISAAMFPSTAFIGDDVADAARAALAALTTEDLLSLLQARSNEVLDYGPFDSEELVRWAENYGHPEGWAKKAQALHGELERLREALQAEQIAKDALSHKLSTALEET